MNQLQKVEPTGLPTLAEPTQQAIATPDAEAVRAAKQVEAQMIVAQRFPRDQLKAYNSIMAACQRKKLADDALYVFPRGGSTVTGPSIRLAEVLAQNWGNLDFGITFLSGNDDESQWLTYCHDLERNIKVQRHFSVRHERKARGKITKLTDPRDIYEMAANYGSRRLRACILAVIPYDIVEEAVEACQRTQGNNLPGSNREDRLRKMLSVFSDMGVSKEIIEKKLGHSIENVDDEQFLELQNIFKSLKDGVGKREDFFDIKSAETGRAKSLNEKLKGVAKDEKTKD